MWEFGITGLGYMIGGAILATILTLVFTPVQDRLRGRFHLRRSVRIEITEERGPVSRQYGFTEKSVNVTVKNHSGADMTIEDVRLMFTNAYGAPVLSEAPQPRSHPKLPVTLDSGTVKIWYFPAEKLSSLLQSLSVEPQKNGERVKVWPRVTTSSGDGFRGPSLWLSTDPNSHWP